MKTIIYLIGFFKNKKLRKKLKSKQITKLFQDKPNKLLKTHKESKSNKYKPWDKKLMGKIK
jgi:hypothetical protein